MLSARDLLARWPALDVVARSARLRGSLRVHWGPLDAPARAAAARGDEVTAGLWQRRPETWSTDAAAQASIAGRLGWLEAPEWVAGRLEEVRNFADAARRDGFTDAVLLGMGGSSLAAEVLRGVLGTAPDWLRLHVLDSTDPATIRAISAPPSRTIYLLASKSGGTIEPNAMATHFARALRESEIERWASHFVAITDATTVLERRASEEGFRACFINPSDIGGRYSALSLFGVIPAALMGQNLSALVGWGAGMLSASQPGVQSVLDNPASALGLYIATAAQEGRDKLTLLLPPSLEPFGLWVEQLVAESLGKSGVGVVPVVGESLAEPDAYGTDRAFVRIRVHGAFAEQECDARVDHLRTGKFPVAEIDLLEPAALGAEFARWEVATAVAGGLLRVNPFDEPDVTRAKRATQQLLDAHAADGQLPEPRADATRPTGIALTLSNRARGSIGGHDPAWLLNLCRPGDYIALLAYLPADPQWEAAVAAFREDLRRRLQLATTFGYGPRYLHSTGQLHKGGPNTGMFLLVTARPVSDLAVPDATYSFGTLEDAQALGDFASLDALDRRALLVRLPSPDPALLSSLLTELLERIGPPIS